MQEPIDWDEDVVVDNAEVYESLVRAIGLTEGFGLFLVRSGNGKELGDRLRSDLPRLNFADLELTEELKDGNLYGLVKEIAQTSNLLNGLIISGLEKSLDPYVKSGYGGLGDYYNKDMVPRVLGHLNLQRERFRDDFPFCLIFVLSAFGVKYIARRAPDFFDWRSGLFEFVPDAETIDKLTQGMYGNYRQYLTWNHEQRIDRIREIQALIDEDKQTTNGKAILFFEKGNILVADQSYKEAIASYEKAIQFKPDKHAAWHNRGTLLSALGRKEEALDSYDKAIEIKSDYHEAWYGRGISLSALGRKEEAIASYDKAIEFKPDNHYAWTNRGVLLDDLGRKEEAIASYDKAIEIKSDDYYAWNNRGNSISALGREEEAIVSYDKAIEIKPDFASAYFNRACAYSLQSDFDFAISDLAEAIRLEPERYRKLAATDSDFEVLRQDARFWRIVNEEC